MAAQNLLQMQWLILSPAFLLHQQWLHCSVMVPADYSICRFFLWHDIAIKKSITLALK
jgi:hypothetical protein|tara:strand:+ start:164 stop:337 length:174 start_codon:yes stop_codon:yes gene_type:complete